MKLLVLTTDPTLDSWDSLPPYKRQVLHALPGFTLDIKYVNVMPVVYAPGYISHVWYEDLIMPYFNKGYDIIGLHMGDLQRKLAGIKPTLRGANPRTGKEYGDFYFWADEHTDRLGYPQFVQTLLHEIKHEYHQQTGTPDDTHAAHKANPDITEAMRELDWSKYQPVRMNLKKQVSLYERVLDLYKQLVALERPKQLLHPVADFKDAVSQEYGVRNSRYLQTRHHIGLDLATPIGTPVVACTDGVITKTGYTKTLGYYCHFTYQKDGLTYVDRYLHLKEKPQLATYKQGDILAITGNSGMSTGPHIHIDIHKLRVDISVLTADNFRQYTVDPEHHYS